MSDITTYLKKQILDAIAPIAEVKPEEINLSVPRDSSHGDYSVNIAMRLGKKLRRNPRQIADLIIKGLHDSNKFIEKALVAGPGFINFTLSPDYIIDALRKILQQGDDFGKTVSQNPEKILVEFVSANPTGPMNVVSARTGAVGDTLVKLLNWSGMQAKSEYYVNDTGNQVNNLALSVDLRYRELLGESVEIPPEAYHGDYIIDLAEKILKEHGPDYFLKEDESRLEFFKKDAIKRIVASQQADLKEFQVTFDRWFFESEAIKAGKVRSVIDRLLGLGLIYDYDGCLWFKSTEYGDDEDRVFIKSDGNPTYFLPDCGYHQTKYDRGFTRLIDIWGPDHHGYIPRMTAALEALGYPRESFETLIVQQVNFLKDGVKMKMSKRAGMIVTMRELIDEVGVDVARYFFLKRRANSHLDFDLDLAKKESDENPVYYVQYAHARICSVLGYAKNQGASLESDAETIVNLSELKKPEELDLIKILNRFPDIISDAARTREVHRLPMYLESVAAHFHQFYHNHRVVTDDASLTQARLALCKVARTVLRNGLTLLGVSAPEKM
ncbi:MAG: arginine--tRNA ligase [Candidatus Cloacimonetes bacterium 4572_55]|nr:MAG: arginine--tRNA ligase [Candidatus Cloacimonetes bacterium 4572_55]